MDIKFKVDTKKVMNDIKKQIEKNPEKLLKQKAGKTISAVCPQCGSSEVLVTHSGEGECTNCKAHFKIKMNVSFK